MTKTPFVLIVEDDEWLAEQYVRVLKTADIRADYVPHALAAIDAIDTHPPDILLLDIMLPGPNAFTLLHELQTHSDLSGIPVIVCTNSADQLKDIDLKAYGVVQILDKATMLPGDIVAAVKKVLP